MYARNNNTPSKEKSQGDGVQLMHHLHKAFLRPYGKAESTPDKDTIARRINSRNCEWVCQPHIAISELADTAHETMVQIAKSPLVDKDALEVMLPPMRNRQQIWHRSREKMRTSPLRKMPIL